MLLATLEIHQVIWRMPRPVTSYEMIECSSGNYDFCVPHHVPAEDLCDILQESLPVAINMAFVGLSIDLLKSISGFLAMGSPRLDCMRSLG